jgi:hypothetical protein
MTTRYAMRSSVFCGWMLLGMVLSVVWPALPISAGGIEPDWGGQVKVQGFVSWPDDESFFAPVGTDTNYDGNTQFRIKNTLFLSDWGYFTTHYEAVVSGGDTRRKVKNLEKLFPNIFQGGLLLGRPVEDDRRLFDLTKTIDEDDSYLLYHRLDRLFLGLMPQWGSLRIGRQAITWGNGLLFNPMDLFNPFAPVDIERDYKIGDDMISSQISVSKLGDFQFIFVPRRDPVNNDAKWNQSSLAGKLHFASGTTEFDIMAAKHYRDAVVGVGSTGYLGDAAWRLDATWTFPGDAAGRDNYLSLVANVDYSWVWWGKNCYGFLEFYYNGLGDDNYSQALVEPAIFSRRDRGDLFVLGKAYMSGTLQIELHPLFNLFLTAINNVEDPSGILQPRGLWDVAEDFQVTVGGNVAYGERGTEFGGFEVAGTGLFTDTPDSAYLWLTYYF